MDDVTVCLMLMDLIQSLDLEGLRHLDDCLDKNANIYRFLKTRMLARQLELGDASVVEELTARSEKDSMTEYAMRRVKERIAEREARQQVREQVVARITTVRAAEPRGFFERLQYLFLGR